MRQDFFSHFVIGLVWDRIFFVGVEWDRIENPLPCHPQHDGLVVGTVASLQEGPGFSVLGRGSALLESACSPYVRMGFLQVLRFPSPSKHVYSSVSSQYIWSRSWLRIWSWAMGAALWLPTAPPGWVKCSILYMWPVKYLTLPLVCTSSMGHCLELHYIERSSSHIRNVRMTHLVEDTVITQMMAVIIDWHAVKGHVAPTVVPHPQRVLFIFIWKTV